MYSLSPCLFLVLAEQAQLEESKAVEQKLKTEGNGSPTQPQHHPEKAAEDAASNLEASDDDNDDEASGEEVQAANVNAAIKALKSQKEKVISKKIQKKLNRAAKKASSKKPKKEEHGTAAEHGEHQGGKTLLDLDECLDFETEIVALRNSSSGCKEQRIKHALDDYLGSLQFARSNLAIKISDSEAHRSKSFLISLFLELAWTSSVAISGKIFKTYSQFRDETQRVFYLAHQRLQVGQKEYDPLQLARDLMSTVQTPVTCLKLRRSDRNCLF